MKVSLVATVLLCLLFLGCDLSFSGNSSGGGSDYFEEPLSRFVKEYEPALRMSNRFVRRFRDQRFEALHIDLSEPLQEVVSPDDLQKLHADVVTAAGDVTEFLPQQWAFHSTKEDDVEVVYSTKIVMHAGGEVLYILKFLDDNKYDKIWGFKINTRNPGEQLIKAVNRIIAN